MLDVRFSDSRITPITLIEVLVYSGLSRVKDQVLSIKMLPLSVSNKMNLIEIVNEKRRGSFHVAIVTLSFLIQVFYLKISVLCERR